MALQRLVASLWWGIPDLSGPELRSSRCPCCASLQDKRNQHVCKSIKSYFMTCTLMVLQQIYTWCLHIILLHVVTIPVVALCQSFPKFPQDGPSRRGCFLRKALLASWDVLLFPWAVHRVLLGPFLCADSNRGSGPASPSRWPLIPPRSQSVNPTTLAPTPFSHSPLSSACSIV